MDLPPFFRHRDNRHSRYGNAFQPPDLFPPPFSPHFSPPSYLPPHVLPPPPPPPAAHIAHAPLPPRKTFSPPHQPLPPLHYDYSLPCMPCIERDILFNPLPPENFSVRIGHDFPERSPQVSQEMFSLRFGRDYPERNPRFGDERHDSTYRGRELYGGEDVSVRRWDSGIDDVSCRLHSKRDDERRWDYHRFEGRVSDSYNDFEGWVSESYYEKYDDRRRLQNGTNDGVSLLLEERQRVSLERDSRLNRFTGRLGVRVSDEDFVGDVKIRRKSVLGRIQIGKASGQRNGDSRIQNVSKKLNRDRFSGENKESFEYVDEKEREQSPVELSITFKSNTLVNKAILSPRSPAVESNMGLSPRNNNVEEVNGCPASPLGMSNIDMVKTDPLKRVLSSPSDSHGEQLDRSALSGNGKLSSNDACDLGKKALLDERPSRMDFRGSNNIQPTRTQLRRRQRKRARKQLLVDISQQKKQGSENIVDAGSPCIGCPPFIPKATIIAEGNNNTSLADKVPDASSPSLFRCVVEKSDTDNSSDKHVSPYLKRKRADLTESIASIDGVHNIIPLSSGHTDRSVDTAKDAGQVNPQRTDDIENHDDEKVLGSDKNVYGGSLGCNLHAHNVTIIERDPPSVVNLENFVIEPIPEYLFPDECVTLENTFLKNPSEVVDSSGDLDIVGPSRPLETMTPEIPENKFVQEILESISASETDCQSVQKPFKGAFSDEDCDTVSLSRPQESSTLEIQVDATQLGLQSLECAAMYASADSDFGVSDSFPSCTKKRKVAGPELILSYIPSDCSNLNPEPERLPELGTDKSEGVPSVAPLTADTKMNIGREELLLADLDKSLANGYGLRTGDGLTSSLGHLSFCDNGKCISTADPDNELIESDIEVSSCPSSPEDLLSYTDFSCSTNTKASPSQSKAGMTFALDTASKRVPMPAKHNTFLLRKNSEKPNSGNLQINAEIPPSLRRDPGKMVQRPNLVYGKLNLESKDQLPSAAPKVFSRPPKFNAASKFHSAHMKKSRTWSRTGNCSVAVSGSNLTPCPLPQSHVTKMTDNFSSSYVRKGNSLVRKPSPSAAAPTGPHAPSSSLYRLSPPTHSLKKSQSSAINNGSVGAPNLLRMKPINASEMPESVLVKCDRESLTSTTRMLGKPLPVSDLPNKLDALSILTKSPAVPQSRRESVKNLDSQSACNEGNLSKRMKYVKRKSNQLVAASECERGSVDHGKCSRLKKLDVSEPANPLASPECTRSSGNNSDSQSALDEVNAGKRIKYVKRRSNQLIAASDSEISGVDKAPSSLSDGYFKRKKNQLVRSSWENPERKRVTEMNLNSGSDRSQAVPTRSRKRQPGFPKSDKSSKFSLVWKLHDAQLSEKHKKNSVGPQKMWPHIFPWKRATYRKNFMLGLGSKPLNSFSLFSQKLLLSRKRGVVYTRSTHGYSLRMSKVISVNGSNLKWSKSIGRNSKKADEEAMRAVAASEKRIKEQKISVPIATKIRSHVSRKSVLSVKLRPGERIFRFGSERYRMDPTRRTLCRITGEETISPAVGCDAQNKIKRSYVPRRLLIGNNEYVRIGNKLVRDPKKRIRVLANEKVRWSLRTARLRLARKKQYCQFFTRFGKCNKDDGKCPYIHDPSKIAVCTKFLNGLCSNPDCKLTHKIIPERMQDCSYFLKGSCSNENCPYRHVNVDPDSSVCESFLRGYCADGNECRKKHTYVCPAFEATGICPQASTCKLHHPKKKTEKKPDSEQKIVRGRYFDGGLLGYADCCLAMTEKLSAKGNDDLDCQEGKYSDYISLDVSDEDENTVAPKQVDIVWREGTFPDYISLDVSDDEVQHNMAAGEVWDDMLPDAENTDHM